MLSGGAYTDVPGRCVGVTGVEDGRGTEIMTLHQSGEDYLEAILILQEKQGNVRSIDIARHLNYSKPSVSRAVGVLRENGYITVSEEGMIHLTEQGRQVAESMYERHRLLTAWLIKLGVGEEVAAEDACKLEHDLSEESFSCLKAHIIGE